MLRRLLLVAAILGSSSLASSGFAAEAVTSAQGTSRGVEVEAFTPEGQARQVRQVTVRFTEPMVALGDPRLADPFEVQCDAPGKGRWADSRNWVFDFDDDLPAGVRCQFTLRRGLAAQDGRAVTGKAVFVFTSGGPAVIRSVPRDGTYGIDEEQVFLLKLDGPATVASVQQHARCAVGGLAEELPVEVLQGTARKSVLQIRRALGYQYFQLLWKSGQVSDVRVRDREMERAEQQLTVLRCQRRLPPGATVTLLWGQGIQAPSGVATSQEQRLTFRVRAAFLAQTECTRSNPRGGCLPMLPITLRFNAPVPRALALAVRMTLADGKQRAPVAPDAAQGEMLSQVDFAPPFPEKKAVKLLLPPRLVDDAGRSLQNVARFPLQLAVDEFPPLAKFAGSFGILEAGEGGVLPVTLRNLEPSVDVRQADLPAKLLRLESDGAAIARWLRRVQEVGEPRGQMVAIPEAERKAAAPKAHQPTDGEEDEEQEGSGTDPTQRWREDTGTKSVFGPEDTVRGFALPKPAGSKPFEVVGIPLKDAGFYVVEIESRLLGQALLGRDQSRYVATAALVTDMAVHFEWGRESSVVWVTRLHDGAPVANAEVVVLDYCRGTELWRGSTGADGIAAVAQSLGTPHGGASCNPYAQAPLFVVAKKEADLSFAMSGWNQGIEPSQFHLRVGSESASRLYHTVLDRALFKAGETVSMKHFLRRHTAGGFALQEVLPGTREVLIEHQGSGQKFSLEAQFGADGVATGEWKIPAEAKLGDYAIYIKDASGLQSSGTFKVEQFRLPTMRASVTGSPVALVQPKSADLDLHVAYMAGGGAGGLPVTLRTLVESMPQQFAAYKDYQFGGKPVIEGVVNNDGGSQDYDFESGEEADSTQSTQLAKSQVLSLTLDGTGTARVTVPDMPKLDSPALLTAELDYADANGEVLSSSGHVQLVPSAVAVGIRPEGWAGSPEQVRFRVVVVDQSGRPQMSRAVSVALYQAKRYSFRKRLIGGFYAYESSTETHKLAARCSGTTDQQGILACDVAPGVAGEILLRAESSDAEQRPSGATASVWVFDKDQAWFGGTTGDRMDVLPEKPSYESGETARFQVRMPFREATALVTVERQGILASFVTHLDGRQPIVEVPVAGNFAPNVFVSVLAVRGRVAHVETADGKPAKGPEITALVDLNKPAYRLGIAGIRVGWKPHRLDVQVTPEHAVYKVRDKAQVRVHVVRADGGALPAGTEVAIAAVDGALLNLAPNPSWDLLASMMSERGLEVYSSTAQLQVVGKRHYGRKAVPSGGGGGRDRTRELFDSLLYWKARVVLDAHGDATVTVPLNDSLSEFRIVAIANGAAGFFGTGSANVNTTQDLILLSGLPPLVREGDQYLATFTLRNASDHAIRADVSGSKTGASAQPLQPQRVELGAGQSVDVAWRVSAPVDTALLRWDIQAQEAQGASGDRLRVNQTVIPAYPVRTYQATITQLAAPFSLPVARPSGSVPGRGGIEIDLRARLGDGLDAVREYLQGYPYICIEQQLSQAMGLRDRAAWDRVMLRLPAYLDPDGLLRYFPTDLLQGDDALTTYVLQIAEEGGWPLAEPARSQMIEGLKRFVLGRVVRGSALPTADLSIRKLAAIEALARYDSADKSMLDSLAIEPALWPTSAVLDWVGILQRVAGIPQAAAKRDAALQILRGRLNFQGTIMGFSTERSDALWWLMISSDSNANRMLLAVLDRADWREDIPRLVRGALSRQQSGHWNTTVANAWGVLAMEKFSARFESVPVTGTTTAQYASASRSVTWQTDHNAYPLQMPWQEAAGALQLSHQGTGRPWAIIRATAALPLTQPISSGYKIRRTITPVEQKQPGRWSRGDVVRVHLDLEAQSDMSWVVVDDPVPAGSSILGSGLGGQSQTLARGERREGWAWPAFEERRFDAFRTYYRFVPKGIWTVEYTLRLNNPGTFLQPATRVEAMYAPEMLGETPNAAVTVER